MQLINVYISYFDSIIRVFLKYPRKYVPSEIKNEIKEERNRLSFN